MSLSHDFVCFLFDNGSFRAESTRLLRTLADQLAKRIGHPVRAVSLLHSTRVPASELGGVPAQLLEPALNAYFSMQPRATAVLLPLFFGPSGALVDYVPERLAALRIKHPEVRTVLAGPLILAEEEPRELVEILADRVRSEMAAHAWVKPKVVLCDHGTPLRAVTAVRDRLAVALGELLAGEVEIVAPASMERREGDEFAFNEPLLATRLATPPYDRGEVVVALQFLSPGRHAGPGGDVAEICDVAEAARPDLRTAMTKPIADDARLVEVLARRFEAAVRALAE